MARKELQEAQAYQVINLNVSFLIALTLFIISGPIGFPGARGPPGVTGNTGEQGIKGAQGFQGERGIKGKHNVQLFKFLIF